MSVYTLKTYHGTKLIERFEHRNPSRIITILDHPRHHEAGKTDPWGDPVQTPDRFEILDSHMYKIFDGGIYEALNFVKGLR
jgi:hypothetical protein